MKRMRNLLLVNAVITLISQVADWSYL